MQKMTPQDAQAWRDRWRAVNAHRAAEVRAMSPEEKLRQLAELMSTQVSAESIKKREAEVTKIRQRWFKLRKAYGCKFQ